jgi:hypothetical protein
MVEHVRRPTTTLNVLAPVVNSETVFVQQLLNIASVQITVSGMVQH